MACLRAEKGAGSSHRPALAFFGSEPHLAWKGVSDDVGSYWSRRIGTSWQPQQNIPAVGTSNSPALVEFNDRLFLFWKGMRDDPNVYFSSLSASDQTWAPQRVVSYREFTSTGARTVRIGTSRGPSATQVGKRILLCWKGAEDDGNIYYSLFDGNQFTGQINLRGVGTAQGPAVVQLRGTTLMAWKGSRDDNTIWFATR
jgi:hypothetical protein